ncbi:MAG TPA: adenosylcobinamide-GDP ribazoletransferase [Ramlibacter sp.]|nr:adenosylcobinamide-GDP ribazoletransferase [Ramlibacter sp.]
MTLLRQYLLAVQSFTRVPVAGALEHWTAEDTPDPVASAAHFPGVGWFVGLVACTVFALVGLALAGSPFAPLAAAVATVSAVVLMTGAVHEEGLASVAGALLPRSRPGQPFDARFDTRVTVQGNVAIVLVLLAKIALLAVLGGHAPAVVLAALFTAQVVSRFWPLVLARGMSYLAGAGPLDDKPFAHPIVRRELGIAAAWCAVPLVLALWGQGLGFVLLALVLSGLVVLWLRNLFARRLQGFNDACIGTTQQLCEIGFYLGAAIGLAT